MKRALNVAALLAMGILVAIPPATAQLPGSSPWKSACTSTRPSAFTTGGHLTVGVLGAEDVDSSKFTEYREVPEGVYLPCFLSTVQKTAARGGPKEVKYDVEKTGFGFKTDARLEAYTSAQPTSCSMKRP